MNTVRPASLRLTVAFVAVFFCVVLSGCEYEVPITSVPTRKLDVRLLGDWVSQDGTENMKVRRLDDSIYIGSSDGDLFRAFHSDVAGTSFISAQNLDSDERKYLYLTYTVSADGNRLALRAVSTKVIPKETKDSVSVQKLLENNLQNPELFNEESQFTKKR